MKFHVKKDSENFDIKIFHLEKCTYQRYIGGIPQHYRLTHNYCKSELPCTIIEGLRICKDFQPFVLSIFVVHNPSSAWSDIV